VEIVWTNGGSTVDDVSPKINLEPKCVEFCRHDDVDARFVYPFA